MKLVITICKSGNRFNSKSLGATAENWMWKNDFLKKYYVIYKRK